jgi:hypothetical protein
MANFTWSFSKLKNLETCPLKHQQVDLLKNFAESSEQMIWGNTVHKALADACTGKAPLPDSLTPYQNWVDKIKAGPGELLVEQKYAITKDFQPTEYFGPKVWYRGIADVVRIDGPVALAVDWKTGKILTDSVQLGLMAQCLFSFHKELKLVRTEYVWLKDDCTTGEVWTRKAVADMWLGLLPRVQEYEKQVQTQTFMPKPSGLCRSYCPVISCPYHGKGNR